MGKFYQKNRYVSFLDAVEDDESLWVADICMNGLFKIKKNGSSVEYIASFDMEKTGKSGSGLYSYAVHYGNQIFFLPANSFNIAVYNQEKEIMQYIYLPYVVGAAGYGTAGYALYGEWIYLFSSYVGISMVRVHMITWKVEELQIWKEIEAKYSCGKENCTTSSVIQINNDVWMVLHHTNKLLKYSLADGTYGVFEYDGDIYNVFGKEDLQELYIVQKDNNQITVWDIENQRESQCIALHDFISGHNKILNILADEETFVFLPYYEKYILLMDRKSGKIRKYDSFPLKFDSFRKDNRFFYQGRIQPECIELFPYMSNGIIRIDRKSGEAMLQYTEIPWQGSTGDLVLQYHYQNSIINAECNEYIYPLEHFLDVLSSDGCQKRGYESGKAGKCIVDTVFSGNGRGK